MSTSRAYVQMVASVNLVFGLDWFAVLGAQVSREAKRIARQYKASHMVVCGDDAGSVGLAAFKTRRKGAPVLHSAAQLLAQRFTSGTVAMVLQLDGEQWWVVAIHEGAVVARTDQLCASAQEAAGAMQQLRQAYSALTVLGETTPAPSLSELAKGVLSSAELRRAGRQLPGLPWPIQGLLIALVLAVFLPGLADWLAVLDEPPHGDAVPVSPDEAWRATLHEVAASHWVHGVPGTQQILQSFHDLPVRLKGWGLSVAECLADQSRWNCSADYERASVGASNDGLIAEARPEWNVSFTPLNKARVQWTLIAQGTGGHHATLNTTRQNERDLFSRLQAIEPAMVSVAIGPSKPVPVAAPTDMSGQALPRPHGMQGLRTRAVEIRSPIRSASLLLPDCEAMGWQRIALRLDPTVHPSLINSRINITFQGVLYEKQ